MILLRHVQIVRLFRPLPSFVSHGRTWKSEARGIWLEKTEKTSITIIATSFAHRIRCLTLLVRLLRLYLPLNPSVGVLADPNFICSFQLKRSENTPPASCSYILS